MKAIKGLFIFLLVAVVLAIGAYYVLGNSSMGHDLILEELNGVTKVVTFEVGDHGIGPMPGDISLSEVTIRDPETGDSLGTLTGADIAVSVSATLFGGMPLEGIAINGGSLDIPASLLQRLGAKKEGAAKEGEKKQPMSLGDLDDLSIHDFTLSLGLPGGGSLSLAGLDITTAKVSVGPVTANEYTITWAKGSVTLDGKTLPFEGDPIRVTVSPEGAVMMSPISLRSGSSEAMIEAEIASPGAPEGSKGKVAVALAPNECILLGLPADACPMHVTLKVEPTGERTLLTIIKLMAKKLPLADLAVDNALIEGVVVELKGDTVGMSNGTIKATDVSGKGWTAKDVVMEVGGTLDGKPDTSSMLSLMQLSASTKVKYIKANELDIDDLHGRKLALKGFVLKGLDASFSAKKGALKFPVLRAKEVAIDDYVVKNFETNIETTFEWPKLTIKDFNLFATGVEIHGEGAVEINMGLLGLSTPVMGKFTVKWLAESVLYGIFGKKVANPGAFMNGGFDIEWSGKPGDAPEVSNLTLELKRDYEEYSPVAADPFSVDLAVPLVDMKGSTLSLGGHDLRFKKK